MVDEIWPMFAHDARNSGRGEGGRIGRIEIGWSTFLGGDYVDPTDLTDSPVVAGDVIFHASRAGLRALNVEDGTERWAVSDYRASSTPAISEGAVYVRMGSNSSNSPEGVHAFDVDSGGKLWYAPLGGSAPIAGKDASVGAGESRFQPEPNGLTIGHETVFVTGGPAAVFALSTEDGGLRWTSESASTRGAPAIGFEQVFARTAENLRAYDVETGERQWMVPATPAGSPSIGQNNILLGEKEGAVRAFDPSDGSERWAVSVEGAVAGPPLVSNGSVYAAGEKGQIVSVSAANGSEQWRARAPGPVEVPMVMSGNTIYAATLKGDVIALNAEDGEREWAGGLQGARPGGVVLTGNGLVATHSPSELVGLRSASSVEFPDVGGWPTTRGDIANTGTAETALPSDTPSQLWTFEAAGGIYDEAVVVDGRVLVPTTRGALYSLSAGSGRLDWRFIPTGGSPQFYNAPAVAEGIAFLASVDQRVFAVNVKSGRNLWETSIDWSPGAVRVVDDVVLAPTQEGRLPAYNTDTGELQWGYRHRGELYRAPAVDEQFVYVGAATGHLVALRRGSNSRIGEATFRTSSGTTAAVANGRVFVGGVYGDVVGFSSPSSDDGGFDRIWRTELPSFNDKKAVLRADPAVRSDRVFVADVHGNLFALEQSSGQIVAEGSVESGTGSGLLTTRDALVVASNFGVHALSLDRLEERWRFEIDDAAIWGLSAVENRILLTTESGQVIAIG